MTDKYTTADLVAYALEAKPIEFQQTFAQLALDKMSERVEARKQEIAASMYAPQAAEEEEENGEDA